MLGTIFSRSHCLTASLHLSVNNLKNKQNTPHQATCEACFQMAQEAIYCIFFNHCKRSVITKSHDRNSSTSLLSMGRIVNWPWRGHYISHEHMGFPWAFLLMISNLWECSDSNIIGGFTWTHLTKEQSGSGWSEMMTSGDKFCTEGGLFSPGSLRWPSPVSLFPGT